MQSKRKQIQEYLALNVNIFVQPMIYQIAKRKPVDPASFAASWLQDYLAKRSNSFVGRNSHLSKEEEEWYSDKVKFEKTKEKGKKKSRIGVSEEVFGIFNQPKSTQIRNIPKTQEARSLIMSLIRESILFTNLAEKEQATIINAMQEKNLVKGEHVITEGQKGDTLFLVAEGEFDCFKKIEGYEKYLKTYVKGESFGQIALMYNIPRTATIISNGNGKVFGLDRMTFNQIVKQAEIKKRQLVYNVICNVNILSEMSDSEQQQFFDVLKQQEYEPGSYVINQGDIANHFYIVLDGKLQAQTRNLNDPNSISFKVQDYEEGSYFGEQALLHDCKTQASVKTVTKTTLAYIERESFMRLLGSFEGILKRNEEKYKNMEKSILV